MSCPCRPGRRAALWRPACLGLLAVLVGCGGHPGGDPLTRTRNDMTRLTYPPTRTENVVDDYHGTQVPDPYRWLEDTDSEETAAWIAAQNRVTEEFLATIPARQEYRERLTQLWDYERIGVPVRHGGRLFYTRNDGLQPQAVLLVQADPDAEPRVLLDPNLLSEDGTVALADWSVSRDGRWLAWATSDGGSDWHTWRVRNIETGEDLPDTVRWSKFSGATWDERGSGFWYSRYDAPRAGRELQGQNRNQKLCFHRRGTSQDDDVLVYERPDHADWGFAAELSDDGRYLVVNVWQGTSPRNGLFYKDLRDRSLVVHELLADFDASYQFIAHQDGRFLVKTNRDAPRGRVVAIDLDRREPRQWQTLVPEDAGVLESATVLGGQFVLTYLKDVASSVRLASLTGDHLGEISLPGLGSVAGFTGRSDDTETWYAFDGYLSPSVIYRLNLISGESTVFRAPTVDFPLDQYVSERVFYTSRDGTRIPLWLVHRADLRKTGQVPVILYGYGGFNVSLTPYFSAARLPWLERGGMWAIANLRGGAEYGEAWHEAGMRQRKQNVFDDFIAAAEYLVREGWTCADKLAVMGGSNGGLLVGAVVNQRPELFGAALPAVGVMDMLRFQHFTIGWAWTSDYGSSDDPAMFPYLHAYSPYHNLRQGVEYPAVLVTTADHDDRVVPGHSFKYIARLQACQAGPLPALIRIETRAGHGAGKPTDMLIAEYADRYAFLTRALDLAGSR
ncbi:MAG: prolyl oligopeptidase family serine peptidase [Candidatus Krumholzibacteriia bacterium]